MNKITIVFCEGQHDIAFLSKILFAHEYKKYDKKLDKFLKPFGNQYFELIKTTEISDKKLGYQSDYKIPSVSLYKDDNLILFHNMGGDMKSIERVEVLNMYLKLVNKDNDFTASYNFEYKFLYFLDSDEKTIEERVQELNSELALTTPLQHNKLVFDMHNYGCYIYSGVLEDILLDLMKPFNDTYFDNSKNYIDTNPINNDRQKEFKCFEETYKSGNKFKEKKSIISIAGQLQFSGMNNSVIIANSDYIKKDDILNNAHCQNIIKFFEPHVDITAEL